MKTMYGGYQYSLGMFIYFSWARWDETFFDKDLRDIFITEVKCGKDIHAFIQIYSLPIKHHKHSTKVYL